MKIKGNQPEGFVTRHKVPRNPISICNPSCANLCPSEAPLFLHEWLQTALHGSLHAQTLLWSTTVLALPLLHWFLRPMHFTEVVKTTNITESASGTINFQTLPPLKKQEGQAQDIICSLSCGCQDLKQLSYLLYMSHSCILLAAWIWQEHTFLIQPHPLLPAQKKNSCDRCSNTDFPCNLDQVTSPQFFTWETSTSSYFSRALGG